MFYTSTVSSVVIFGSASWGGNAAKQDRDTPEKVIQKAGGVVGRRQDSFDSAYNRRVPDRLTTMFGPT